MTMSLGVFFLTIIIKHHTGISAGHIRTVKRMARILISDNYFVNVVNRVKCDIVTLAKYRLGECLKGRKCLWRLFKGYGFVELIAIKGEGSVFIR